MKLLENTLKTKMGTSKNARIKDELRTTKLNKDYNNA